MRSLALPIVGVAIYLSTAGGCLPSCQPGELRIRKVGQTKSIYWISTHSRDVLVLAEPWQLKRGRSMLREMGCLKEPEVRVLDGAPLRFRWGSFRWQNVEPYLPASTFVEIQVSGKRYFLRSWDPA